MGLFHKIRSGVNHIFKKVEHTGQEVFKKAEHLGNQAKKEVTQGLDQAGKFVDKTSKQIDKVGNQLERGLTEVAVPLSVAGGIAGTALTGNPAFLEGGLALSGTLSNVAQNVGRGRQQLKNTTRQIQGGISSAKSGVSQLRLS